MPLNWGLLHNPNGTSASSRNVVSDIVIIFFSAYDFLVLPLKTFLFLQLFNAPLYLLDKMLPDS